MSSRRLTGRHAGGPLKRLTAVERESPPARPEHVSVGIYRSDESTRVRWTDRLRKRRARRSFGSWLASRPNGHPGAGGGQELSTGRIPMRLLNKSRFLAGCQCPRRLWLGSFAPELGARPDVGLDARLETGIEIGRHARALFPGGVLVDEAGQHDDPVTRTRTPLADPAVPAIFEAAFVHAGVRVRVDVLERLSDGGWGVREVKSGTRVRDVHLQDAAVQRFVLEGSGLRVRSVEIIHVDASYVRGEDGIDWLRFFRRADVTTEVERLLPDVPARVEALRAVLSRAEAPVVEPDGHCFTPHTCEFWIHCTRDKPPDWIFYLPGHPDHFAALRAAGIERIVDIPDDFPLSPRQLRVRNALRSRDEFVSHDLVQALASLGPPADYLDFETANPAIPLYSGTRPYEHIPFQWSLHRLEVGGRLVHHEFLASGRGDPRREFAESLLALLGPASHPILVYSEFESRILGALAQALPDLAGAIGALTSRLHDLLPVVRAHLYHPGFSCSFSLKAVAPALAPGFGYDDLGDVAEGSAAADALLRLALGRVGSVEEENRLRAALLAYCERDTMALVALHRAMCERAGRVAGIRRP